MNILKEQTQIDFLGKRKLTILMSCIIILIGLGSITMHKGLNYGVDFRGGTNVQIRFSQSPNLDELRSYLGKKKLGTIIIQTFGAPEDHEILLALPVDSPLGSGVDLTQNLKKLLDPQYPKLEIRRIESIGPKVGAELKWDALMAIMIALGLVLLYITFRFQWKLGVSAIVALVHDVLVVVGVFSILDKEFSLAVVAALLTVVGYSLNDTIVVFDRVRENLGRYRKKSLIEVLNLSINETLSRTILTSLTTLLVVVVLFVFGGEIINDFAFALMVGIFVGTYSSIYIASPMVLLLSATAPEVPAVQASS